MGLWIRIQTGIQSFFRFPKTGAANSNSGILIEINCRNADRAMPKSIQESSLGVHLSELRILGMLSPFLSWPSSPGMSSCSSLLEAIHLDMFVCPTIGIAADIVNLWKLRSSGSFCSNVFAGFPLINVPMGKVRNFHWAFPSQVCLSASVSSCRLF